jgi:hypothetical protein
MRAWLDTHVFRAAMAIMQEEMNWHINAPRRRQIQERLEAIRVHEDKENL